MRRRSTAARPIISERPLTLELVGRGVLATITKPWQIVRLAAPTTRTLVETSRRARRGTAMAAPLTAPRTSFNGTITGHRSIAYTDVSLDTIKDIKKAIPGATVNDVVLALSGGALRRYLEKRGELPESSLLASVPVSVRSESKKAGRNQVSSIFCRLGTDVEDPLERITGMSKANANAKDHGNAVPPTRCRNGRSLLHLVRSALPFVWSPTFDSPSVRR